MLRSRPRSVSPSTSPFAGWRLTVGRNQARRNPQAAHSGLTQNAWATEAPGVRARGRGQGKQSTHGTLWSFKKEPLGRASLSPPHDLWEGLARCRGRLGPQARWQRMKPHLMAVEMERRGWPITRHPQDPICILNPVGNTRKTPEALPSWGLHFSPWEEA